MNNRMRSGREGFLLGICLLVTSAACPGPQVKPDDTATKTAASTTLEARSGTSISGDASFAQEGDTVRVVVNVKGATPGEHGLHIHEKGDCSAADAASAGPHFNPHKMDHGGVEQSPRHAGDLGNMTIGADGSGRHEVVLKGLTVVAGELSVVVRALVLHEKPDDLRTQPSGNSGARIGCGVIVAK